MQRCLLTPFLHQKKTHAMLPEQDGVRVVKLMAERLLTWRRRLADCLTPAVCLWMQGQRGSR